MGHHPEVSIIKVILINNYSMTNAYALWEKGTSGSHHVWGKVELERKGHIAVEAFPHQKFRWLNKIGNLIGITHLDQQIRVLGEKNFDILYAPYALANTTLLILMKWMRLFRKPIVVTIHQSFLGTRSKNKLWKKITKSALLQYDAAIFLSEPLMEEAIRLLDIPLASVEEKFRAAQWGPDTEFYDVHKKDVRLMDCSYAVSAGHTDRDYETLIEAFRKIDFPLKIYCTPESAPKTQNLPPNVTVNSKRIPYIELLEVYQNSRMILIPMIYPKIKEGCQGMTGIQDVVALGKPTIITRNVMLNIDVEKEGFGCQVDMGDVQSWIYTLNKLINNEESLNNMASNASRVYKSKFNSEIFAETLEKVFFDVAHRNDKIEN